MRSSRLNSSNGVTDFRLFPRFHERQPCYFYYITLAGFSRVSLLANRHFDNGDKRDSRNIISGTVRIETRVKDIASPPDDYFLIRMLDRFTQLLAPTCLVTR